MLHPLISDTAIISASILGDPDWFQQRHKEGKLLPMLSQTLDGWHPHEIVAMHGHVEVLRLLIENYGEELHKFSNCTKVMTIAAIHNQIDVLRYLLLVCPQRMRPEDGHVLQLAANHDFIDLIKFLVEEYPEPFNISENNDYALTIAVTRKYDDLVKYLVEEVPKHRQQLVDFSRIPDTVWNRLYPDISKDEMIHRLRQQYGNGIGVAECA